jgi:nitroreductase
MKKIIKKVLPKWVINYYHKIRTYLLIKSAYNTDRKRFVKSAFELSKQKSKENIEAKIIFNYHSIEKGLSNVKFREGFGKNALTQLIMTLQEYVKNGYDRNNLAFQTGISVINEYIQRHKDSKIDIKYLENNMNILKSDSIISDTGGIFSLKSEDIISKSKLDFKSLALNRYSVRDYSNTKVDIEIINEALRIASKTPSVCNRQPWHTYVIRDKSLSKSILEIQKGFNGYGSNLDTLILITSNNSFLSGYNERNQGFVDAGMFSMSLIYAIHYLGLATCPLNACLPNEQELKVRELLSVPETHNLVMFIAIGSYDKVFLVPKSKRFGIEEKTSYF